MQENDKQIFKLRIKLKSGEEFEAEGSLSFIEQQKEAFLRISNLTHNIENEIGRSYEQKIIPTTLKPSPNTHYANPTSPTRRPQSQNQLMPSGGVFKTETNQDDEQQIDSISGKKYSQKSDIWGNPVHKSTPTIYKPVDSIYSPDEENPADKYNPAYFNKQTPAKRTSRKPLKPSEQPIPKPDGSVWDRIAYAEGPYIIIRRKDKSITTAIAALILLGSARMLKDTPKMSALELSKSLKLSGYLKENERLDRILAPEIKQNCLVYEGSKRNRDYIITQSGTAKAYTTAERILLNG